MSIPGDFFCGIQMFISFFLPMCWENTFSLVKQKLINTAAVTEQTTETFYWKRIGFIYREVEFTETYLVT